ncbi:hypothetical protein EDB81DRAFT_138797 [Dactylonectria macrodidyma]|uniref:Uncharacterized protein n=1 Tax=Dactylonectria macrodidyma TaxID=307937 RepID=A0A9P9IS18_9HYPO|nr:hypothetical protein EDB81DRAFT_138797 [Dactylonectria macrodidyma]
MPVDSTGVVEDFEWRFQSRGIVSDYSSYGYELRRITNGEADVVAVLGLGAWSLHKAFTFALLDDGLEAQYGKAWEAVALATGVQTYLLEVERIASVAGAGA